jgi:filamentous hemagglutinin family protein
MAIVNLRAILAYDRHEISTLFIHSQSSRKDGELNAMPTIQKNATLKRYAVTFLVQILPTGSLLGIVGTIVLEGAAIAQPPPPPPLPTLQIGITADNTLGSESSRVIPQTPQNQQLNIQGGALRGSSLFHSFRDFNVVQGQTVVFSNLFGSKTLDNIFARVTGSSRSTLNGTLNIAGNTNFFLLNPNGILFGPTASINLNGAFNASTAQSLLFGDIRFSATNPTPVSPLLTVSSSIGFEYGSNPQPIQVNGTVLTSPDNQRFLLLGGEVQLTGAVLQAPGGRIGLGGLAAPGTVTLQLSKVGLANFLSFPTGVSRANVTLSNQASVDLFGQGDGEIAVFAGNLSLNNSEIATGITVNSGLTGGRAGDILIDATGDITLSNNSIFRNEPRSNALGAGGNIQIRANNLTVQDSVISTDTFSTGDAGNIAIVVANQVLVQNVNATNQNSRISSSNQTGTTGKAGTVQITADRVLTQKGASVFVQANGTGEAGDVIITAKDVVLDDQGNPFTGQGGIIAVIQGGSPTTQGGDVLITTDRLTVENGAIVSVDVLGQGISGNVQINAGERITVSGRNDTTAPSQITAALRSGAIGRGGNIILNTSDLVLNNGADLSISTSGIGDGGDLDIVATGSVTLQGTQQGIPSRILAQVGETGVGQGGRVSIDTSRLIVQDGGQISATTLGRGNAGSVTVNATGSITLQGSAPTLTDNALREALDFVEDIGAGIIPSGLMSSVLPTAQGKGGDITVTTPTLTLTGGAQIIANTSSGGSAGDIDIFATDLVSLTGSNTGLFAITSVGSTGAGGSISILLQRRYANDPQQVLIQNGAAIAVGSEGSGQGGRLTITADNLTLNNNASISAVTRSSQGGDIILTIQDFLLLFNNSFISTEAGTAQAGGNGGDVTIDAKFIIGKTNADIIANAFAGNGGNITITTDGLFGFTVENTDTPLTDPRNNITASSRFGVSNIPNISNTINPGQGLAELPTNLIDLTHLISENLCHASQGSSFTNLGLGGMPPLPREALSLNQTWEDRSWGEELGEKLHSAVSVPVEQARVPIVREAQGWMRDGEGNVLLMAQSSQVTPQVVRSGAIGRCK